MSTNRSINSRLWSDGWIRKLNALDRYVFIYFLTNEHSTWCGVYEIPLDIVSHETGVKENDIIDAILPRLSPKIIYLDGWVYIPNWTKYHMSESGTISPQQKKGMETAWSQVPEKIRLKIRDLTKNDIPYTYPIGGVSPSTSTSTSTTSYSKVENSTSQPNHLLSDVQLDSAEVTISDIDEFGSVIKKSPIKEKKTKVSDERVIKIITEWNKYPVASVLSMGKVPNKTSEKELLPLAISNFSLDKRIKDRLRFFPDISQWEKAIKKYVEDIINRQPTNDYAQHRFSLYDFVNQDNGFVKFVNK